MIEAFHERSGLPRSYVDDQTKLARKAVIEGMGAGAVCTAVSTDVTYPASVEGLFARIREDHGRLDVVFQPIVRISG